MDGSICRVVQGERITAMRSGTHPDLRLSGLFAQLGDSVKEATEIIIRRGETVLAEIEFKSGENAGKIQIGDIGDNIMIYKDDEIEIEPNGTRRVAVFLTFEPGDDA